LNFVQDYYYFSEAQMRIQYNTIHAERVKVLSTQLNMLKNIQKDLPPDLCKFQKTETSVNMLNSGQDLVGNMRKNLMYTARSTFEEMRNDHSNIVYNHLVMMTELLEDCAESSKSYFTDGKACVIGLESNIKIYLESSSNRIIQCIKNATVTYPLQHSKFKTDMDSVNDIYDKQSLNTKKPFYIPIPINKFSTKVANETASTNLLTVSILLIIRHSIAMIIFLVVHENTTSSNSRCGQKFGKNWS
jgi:hypothetical protein